jgi:ferritin
MIFETTKNETTKKPKKIFDLVSEVLTQENIMTQKINAIAKKARKETNTILY